MGAKHQRGLDENRSGRARLSVMLFASAATALLAQSAKAAPAARPQGSNAADNATAVSTIVVTAQKREENVQTVALSVSAFSGAQLTDRQVNDFSDLAQIAPGAFYSPGHRDTASIEMRGSTTASTAPAVDSGVSVYVDEVPTIGDQELNQEFFDLDRIEVLRGPQGTLFGRNVTGGLISLHTLDPRFTTDFRLSGGYGNYNDYRLQGYVTGPLSDKIAASLAISAHGHDGYQHDVIAVGPFGGTDEVSGRAKVLFKPNEDLTIVLSGDFYSERGSAGSNQLLSNVQPNTVLPQYPVLSFSPSDTNVGVKGTGGTDNYSFTGRLDWNTAIGTLTSISGYRSVHNFENDQANAGDPLGDFLEYRNEPDTQFTQEVRLASKSDQRFRWLLGAFFLDGHSAQDFPVVWDYSMFPAICSATKEPAFGYFIGLFNGCTSNILPGDFSQKVHLQDEAIFGQVEFDIFPKLTAIVGGRESWERRDGVNHYSKLNILYGPEADVPFSASINQFTPKFSLRFTPYEALMIYGLVSEGFKGPGFDIFSGSFPEETTWNYEGGIKTTLFEHRVIANVTVFDQQYHNLQLRVFDPSTGLFLTGTVSKATVEGVEAEFAARPVRWLTLGGSWTYQDPKQGTGLLLQYSPRNSLNVYAEGKWPVEALAGTISIGGDITFKSSFWTTNANNDPGYVHSRTAENGVVNLHVSWTSQSGACDVTAWAKNVGNQRYLTFGGDIGEPYFYPAAVPGQIYGVLWNDPATYGLTLTYHMK